MGGRHTKGYHGPETTSLIRSRAQAGTAVRLSECNEDIASSHRIWGPNGVTRHERVGNADREEVIFASYFVVMVRPSIRCTTDQGIRQVETLRALEDGRNPTNVVGIVPSSGQRGCRTHYLSHVKRALSR